MYSVLCLYWSAYQTDGPVTGVKGCTVALLAVGDDAERAYAGRFSAGRADCCELLFRECAVAAGDMTGRGKTLQAVLSSDWTSTIRRTCVQTGSSK